MVGKQVDKANRIFFVSKEGAASYANAENMAPVLVSTKTVAVSEIKVNAPTKTVYDLGESLDTTGMTVTASYEDGTEDVVDLSKVIITGFDSSKVAEKQTVTVKYAGQTLSLIHIFLTGKNRKKRVVFISAWKKTQTSMCFFCVKNERKYKKSPHKISLPDEI